MLIDETPIALDVQDGGCAPHEVSSIHSIAAQAPEAGKPHDSRISLFTAWIRRSRAASLMVVAFLLAACASPPDETALRERIGELQAAIEARDADALIGAVDANFGGPGGMDRDGLRRYATLMLLRQQQVGVVIGPVEVELFGDRAAARFDVVVTGANRFVPEGMEARRVETAWRRDGGAWVLVSADWSKPALAN